MKHSIIITGIIALALSSQLVNAGSITDTYATGDTLTATKMDSIKAAVNDNDTNISTNTGNINANSGSIVTNTTNIGTKQNRVTGTCPTGQSIRVINANGTVTCEVDTDTNTTYTAGKGLKLTGTTFSYKNTVVTAKVVNCPGSLAAITSTYQKVGDIATFTKTSSDSIVEVTFNGTFSVASMTGNSTKFELRMDNLATTNGVIRAYMEKAQAGTGKKQYSFSGVFTGKTAGLHTVSIWAEVTNSGTGTGAFIDSGCFSSDHVVITETY